MLLTTVLIFFAGIFGANAVPHFVKGITKELFPTPFGPSPVVNLIAGWAMLIFAALLVFWTEVDQHPMLAFLIGALGVLLMGLFHATIGAFGRRA
jgi:hypothetical protein